MTLARNAPPSAPVDDFAAYWTASHQLLAGNNPYDVGQVQALEHQLGSAEPAPVIMRNPPWALPFVLPLALLPYPISRGLWFLLALALVLACVVWLWRLYDGPKQRLWVAGLAAGMFLPTAAVLAIGQIGPLILFGITAFLVLEKRQQDFWAGASLLAVALKPHLVFLFWMAFLLWVLRERRWRALVGLAAALLAASGIALAFDRAAFGQYAEMLRQQNVFQELTFTVGSLLRLRFGLSRYWLEYLPAPVGLIWLGIHWRRRRQDWRWAEQMPLLLLVSLLTTAYARFFDEVVLMPCVAQATAGWLSLRLRDRVWPAIAYLGLNGLSVVMPLLTPHFAWWYGWMEPAWLALYLVVRRKKNNWKTAPLC